MSAYRDILAALQSQPSIPQGHERYIFVGVSAAHSLACEGLTSEIAGHPVAHTDEFPGWEIGDVAPL